MKLLRLIIGENFPFKSFLNQFLSAIAVNIITISHGAALGWVSPFLPYLQSSETHLTSGEVTIEQASWIGSLLSIGGFIGAPTYGFLADRFGKKRGLQLLVIPYVASWLCILCGPNVYYIYLGRILAGTAGGGVYRAIPLYIADIAHNKLRGMLGSLLIISLNVGFLLGFVFGSYLSYFTVPVVMLAAPTIFLLCTFFIPETPYCLLERHLTEQAEQSLMFYRGIWKNCQKTDDFKMEFEQLQRSSQTAEEILRERSINWRDFCTKQARKGLGIGTFLMALNQFSGSLAIMTYTANIFQESGSDLSPNASSIILALIQLIGTIVSFILVDNLGRKVLLLMSTIGATVGLFCMGLFSFLQLSGSLPILSLSFTILFLSFGILPLPHVILAEVLPQKIRSIGSTIGTLMFSASAFVILKLFPIMIDRIHLYGTMWFHTSICFIGIFVILFIVPETKGKNLLGAEDKSEPTMQIKRREMKLLRLIIGENFPFKSFLNQFLSAVAVNIITISHGAALGWVSPFLPYLQSSETHLTSGAVTIEQASWIGSLLCIGGFIGAPTYGFLADRFGKKRGLQLLVIPHVAFWLCILCGPNVYYIYLGRILAGTAGGGVFRAIPLYIADIAHNKLRGMLGSLLIISLNAGFLLGFVFGSYLSYFTVPVVMLAAPTIFLLCTFFLPETPYCLLERHLTEKAEQSLMFYRGIWKNCQKTDDFKMEFEQLQRSSQTAEEILRQRSINWRDFCTKQARKGLGIGTFLMALNQFSGSLAIMTYTANIFQESGSDLSPNASSIIVALIQLIGTIVSFILVDNLGRKILLLMSTIGATVGLFCMGLSSFLQLSGSLPILSLSFTILFLSFGILPLPHVILAEVLPQKIRSIGSTIGTLMFSASAFVILKLFPIMIDRIHLYGTMWFHTSICFIGIFVILFVVPETKGKNLLGAEDKSEPTS
ncbi:uncharacterized protein LOC134209707 [Armigeres subalbatus]|uniref:uncharacterized protein LOC134209707 n=1 Tax=Armigeres subalbatus TaxID=124917 RepID=UPI002ED3EF9A